MFKVVICVSVILVQVFSAPLDPVSTTQTPKTPLQPGQIISKNNYDGLQRPSPINPAIPSDPRPADRIVLIDPKENIRNLNAPEKPSTVLQPLHVYEKSSDDRNNFNQNEQTKQVQSDLQRENDKTGNKDIHENYDPKSPTSAKTSPEFVNRGISNNKQPVNLKRSAETNVAPQTPEHISEVNVKPIKTVDSQAKEEATNSRNSEYKPTGSDNKNLKLDAQKEQQDQSKAESAEKTKSSILPKPNTQPALEIPKSN